MRHLFGREQAGNAFPKPFREKQKPKEGDMSTWVWIVIAIAAVIVCAVPNNLMIQKSFIGGYSGGSERTRPT